MPGQVLAFTCVGMEDKHLSMGHFFNVAKKRLNMSERERKLVIGRITLNVETITSKFFAFPEIHDAMAEYTEVKISVVRVDTGCPGEKRCSWFVSSVSLACIQNSICSAAQPVEIRCRFIIAWQYENSTWL